MKHFLVTTDFSDAADNAVNYAVELAKKAQAAITLFHAYSVPVMVSDAPVMPVISYEELEKDNLELLKKIQNEINSNSPGVKVDIICRIGFPGEEISKILSESHFDLTIMGIKGHGTVSQFFGSTSTTVAKNSVAPVLIVPLEARFKNIPDIAFAFDYREINEPRNIKIIQEIAKLFNSRIHVLNISGQVKEIPIEKALVAVQIDHILEEVNHELSFPANEDPVLGIEEYLTKNKCDLLVMIKRKHGFFDSLFKGSYTKKMAFHTHIPLLVLHD